MTSPESGGGGDPSRANETEARSGDAHGVVVSVVMPCYNEAPTILESVKRVIDVPFRKEIIVVDDGSTDGTREILQTQVEKLPTVRGFYLDRNRGKGAALRRGF